MVLVHAHCVYTRILHRHNMGIALKVVHAKVREPIRACVSDFRDVRAKCSREVTSYFHSVYRLPRPDMLAEHP